MALPFPNDPSAPSSPNPYFQDNNMARGDQLRGNNEKIWSNLDYLETDKAPLDNPDFTTRIATPLLKLWNNAKTQYANISGSFTATRTITIQDKDQTLAGLDDIYASGVDIVAKYIEMTDPSPSFQFLRLNYPSGILLASGAASGQNNYSALVPQLRSRRIYLPKYPFDLASAVYNLTVNSYTTSGTSANVLTLFNSADTQKFLNAIAERDKFLDIREELGFMGGSDDQTIGMGRVWPLVVSLGSAINNIPVGDYSLVNYDTSSLTLTIAGNNRFLGNPIASATLSGSNLTIVFTNAFTSTPSIGDILCLGGMQNILSNGTYVITAVNAGAKSITIPNASGANQAVAGGYGSAFAAINYSGTGSGTCALYAHRIAGSSISAQWIQLTDTVLSQPGNEVLGLMPVRDSVQAFTYGDAGNAYRIGVDASNNSTYPGGSDLGVVYSRQSNRPLIIMTNNTNHYPRTGFRTRSRTFGAGLYLATGAITVTP